MLADTGAQASEGYFMRINLSDHFTYRKLLRFVLSPILMMVFTSIYGVIDGLFISRYVGKDAFAAVNLIMPFLMIIGSIGFMLGTGGTAIVSRLLGEGERERANRNFSLFVLATAVGGVIFAVVGEIICPVIAKWLKAEGETYDYCVLYGRILIGSMPFFMLQNVFQAFFSTAERPMLGFIVTAIAGCTNIVADGLLVGLFRFGVAGAAAATAASQIVGAVLPVFYFALPNKSLLRLGRPKFSFSSLFNACTNGVSEFVNNVSSSIVSIVFNYQLMRLVGNNGVSAYGVLMYVNFIYIAIFIGYSIGTAPLIGYNYGAQNTDELKNIFKKSTVIMIILGVLMTALALALSRPIALLFVGYDAELCDMTEYAFHICSFIFIFAGFSIFCSSLFTALGNGLISALISFLRTIVFQIIAVLVLPIFFGITGLWLATVVSDVLATLASVAFVLIYRKKYKFA